MTTQDESQCLAWNIAAKAENVRANAPEKLSMLLFLEAILARPNGLAKAASEIAQLFPHRLNSAVRGRIEKTWTRSAAEMEERIRETQETHIARDIQNLVAGWNVGSYSTSIDGFERSLADYQRIYKERRAEEFVHTNVSRVLFDTLDYALEPWDSAPIVFAEGLPSIGKTTAAEAWAEQHLGEARFISLRALNSKSTFMRTLCESLRLPIARSASGATAMQGRVEHFLHETKIMLVIDRAEHLFPKGKGNAHPALLDYLSTLQDDGIPIALITWGQVFGERLKAIQESTSWASHTFIGRISRCASLGTPTVEDCAAVTRKALPEACAIGVRLISKVACESRRYLQGVSDLASEARRIAKREGRAQVTLKDIQTATEQRINSEVMMRRMFSGAAPRRPVAPQSDAQPIPARQAQLPAPAENAREAFARNITGSGAGVSADRARPLASALEIQK